MGQDIVERIYRSIECFEEKQDECMVQEMAAVSCFSVYHYSRIFTSMTGMSPGLYCRRRLLTKAVYALKESDVSILNLALDTGYETQESFTRAFKNMFGVNPGRIKKDNINLETSCQVALDRDALNHIGSGGISLQPDFREYDAISISGVSVEIDYDDVWQADSVWQEYFKRTESVPDVTYGVCQGTVAGNALSSRLTYLAGHEGRDDRFVQVSLESGQYAVFKHSGDLKDIITTLKYIWQIWVPRNNITLREVPDFEVYGPKFDQQSLKGEIEIWLPVKG